MSGILVIESDPRRRILLRTLLRQHAQVEVMVAPSVKAAITSFHEYRPDVIVTPSLLSCEDSDRLCAHVKRYAEPHVQMLSLPALDLLYERPKEGRERFRFFRRRRPAGPGLLYDPVLVGQHVAESLLRARQMRGQREVHHYRRLLLAGNVDEARPIKAVISLAPLNERRVDRRLPQRSPWVWTVLLPGGATADVVNISRTGILIESQSLLSPGLILELCVAGGGVSVMRPARFVRSEFARQDKSGVFYHAAAHFNEPVAIPGLRPELPPHKTLRALTSLRAAVAADSNSVEAPAA